MSLKGVLFWAGDIPSVKAPHFVVVTSYCNEEGKVLLIPISSIKFSENGMMEYNGKKCKYYDDACVIKPADIPYVITKPSFARYQYARVLYEEEITENLRTYIYDYKGRISDSLLKRIQEGAGISENMKEKVYTEFSKFF